MPFSAESPLRVVICLSFNHLCYRMYTSPIDTDQTGANDIKCSSLCLDTGQPLPAGGVAGGVMSVAPRRYSGEVALAAVPFPFTG